jgi:hypothetical protein
MQQSYRTATTTISILRSFPLPANSDGSPSSVLLCVRTNAGTRYHFITFAKDKRFGLVDAITIGRAWGNSSVVIPTIHCTSLFGLNMVVQLNIVVTLCLWNWQVFGMISDLRREEAENCALLGYYAPSSGNLLPTFRDSLLDSWTHRMEPIDCPETSVRSYHYSLRNNPEERISRTYFILLNLLFSASGWSLVQRSSNDCGVSEWSWSLDNVEDLALCGLLHHKKITVEPGYNDIGLYDTSPITSYILWCQSPIVNHNIIILGYNDTKYPFPVMTL